MWSPECGNQNEGVHATKNTKEPCFDLAGNQQIKWSCVRSCMSVCICVCSPVAMPSPPLTPTKELKGTEVMHSNLWQNCDVQRITWECAPKSMAGSRPVCLHVRLSSLVYLHMVYSVRVPVLSTHREEKLLHQFHNFKRLSQHNQADCDTNLQFTCGELFY